LSPQRPCAVGFVLRLNWTFPGAKFATQIAGRVVIKQGCL
jgi:hypothetical protein